MKQTVFGFLNLNLNCLKKPFSFLNVPSIKKKENEEINVIINLKEVFMTWIRIWIWVHFFPIRIHIKLSWSASTVIYLVVQLAIHCSYRYSLNLTYENEYKICSKLSDCIKSFNVKYPKFNWVEKKLLFSLLSFLILGITYWLNISVQEAQKIFKAKFPMEATDAAKTKLIGYGFQVKPLLFYLI